MSSHTFSLEAQASSMQRILKWKGNYGVQD